jgi:DNA-binding transcriptional ArsR family regulator
MSKDEFLKLTNAVYKILEYFPESDPLKNRAKDRALAIMDHLVLINQAHDLNQKEKTRKHLLEDIDILLGYFWIAKSHGWVSPVTCLVVANEYEKIRQKNLSAKPNQPSKPVLHNKEGDRKKAILDFLAKNGKAQVMDLQTVLPEVTKRTIRRDLDELLEGGKIARFGQFNQVFYQVKS